MRREVGHAELDERRRCDDRADDVGRRHRHREADDPHDERREHSSQQQRAAGVVDHDRAELQAQTGERDDTDDDSRTCASGGDVEHADRATLHRLDERRVEQVLAHRTLALEQVVGQERTVAPQEAGGERHDGRPEHRQHGRETPQHEDDDRNQRQEMEPVVLREIPDAVDLVEHDVAHTVLARVDLDHQEQRQVIQQRRHDGHQQHVEVGDLQELGDQERRGAEHRRRDDCAQATRGEQAAGGVFLVTHLGEHRVGHGTQRHRGRDPRARRAAQEERREHDAAPRAGGLAAHRRERKVDVELARARVLQERTEDREQDNERRRYVHRDAVDSFQRHVHHANQPAHFVALVRPRRRQQRAHQRIGDEA